jgi:hypothetical protein
MPGAISQARVRSMNVNSTIGVVELTRQWDIALNAATSAVEAGWKARSLSPEYGSAELRHIRAEREWLTHFDWSDVGVTTSSFPLLREPARS